MEAVLECCVGLDVHKKQWLPVLFLVLGNINRKKRSERLGRKPVWNILETGSFKLILANAQRIKNAPGRKTDVKDAEWQGLRNILPT